MLLINDSTRPRFSVTYLNTPFRYDPRNFEDEPDDVSDMEADWHTIEREEKRRSVGDS